MPPFPERESSILAKLKKKKGPGAVSSAELEDGKREGGELNGGGERPGDGSAITASNAVRNTHVHLSSTRVVCVFITQQKHALRNSAAVFALHWEMSQHKNPLSLKQ